MLPSCQLLKTAASSLTQLIEESYSILDCSGVAAISVGARSNSGGAIMTSGTGDIVSIADNGLINLARYTLQWDNHVYQT